TMSNYAKTRPLAALAVLVALALTPGCGGDADAGPPGELTDAEVEQLVQLAYPYVALYNVNNKFAVSQGGWNTIVADTRLKDHTLRNIARPNNDTFYISALLDLRNEPMILSFPGFESDYASLMITGYDHFVNVPMATRLGNFEGPERILVYTERTEGYDGEPVDGVDRIFEATGDFVSAVVRLMPHANEPRRMARIADQAEAVTLQSLSEYLGEPGPVADDPQPPDFGETDEDLFEDNLLEVLQYVFNHTTFQDDDAQDQAVLSAFAPFGIEPGSAFDDQDVQEAYGPRFRAAAESLQDEWLSAMADPATMEFMRPRMFQVKGETDPETVLAMSIIGPIGLPQQEAVYPSIGTADGEQMNALHDYVMRMGPDELPPADAFWSVTLYDLANGFFIPNDRKKYSVGRNGGMQLNDEGGIEIHVAAEQPPGVPEENWLPIERKDEDLNVIMRLYVPDLEAYEDWTPPVFERVDAG
ncbi:MAG TPA: DUF1214 domain-containing protein, partial [Longimicrobiales bacterium]|nr:DUF1214 domain-containing protein [Longimicrobiales bacterium]